MSSSAPPFWVRSLQAKFLLRTIPFVFFYVSVLVGTFEYITFERKFSDLTKKIESIASLNTDVLKNSLWNLDHERIDLIVTSIATNYDVTGVIVRDSDNKVISKFGLLESQSSPKYTKSHTITYDYNGTSEKIGTLSIVFTDASIRNAVKLRIWETVILTLLILAVSVVSALIINKRIIGKPLSLLVTAINKTKKETTYDPIEWDSHDEIGQVISAFNASQITLHEHETAIIALNNDLERRVEKRTHDLKASEKRFNDFTIAASDWYWEMDRDLRFSFVSERFQTLVNFKNTDVIGKTRREVVKEELISQSSEKWDKHFADLDAHRPFRDFEFESITPDGDLVNLSISAVPVFDDAGEFQGYRGSGRNITEQIQEKVTLENLMIEADKANKAKSKFLSSMSHELRTPLNAILGFAQILELDVQSTLDSKQRSAITQIKRGGEHLLDLINDVLNLAKIESGQLNLSLESVDTKPVINECVTTIQALPQSRGITIDISGFEGVCVLADRVRLTQAILNLLSNAVKYNHKGGTVRVTSDIINENHWRLTVTDTGPGIPVCKQNDLFQPFSRLGAENSTIEGTGIGLAITKQILEAMNGKIGFKSSTGKGASFWLELPIIPPTVITTQKPSELDMTNTPQPEIVGKVIYVEDNPANIVLMETILGDLPGIHLECAHTAELGLAAALQTPPDLILMDINLPGMNGEEALGELRKFETTQNIPVIAISAAVLPNDIKRGLDAGFLAYLTKPFNVPELLDMVSKILKKIHTPL